MSTIFNSLFSIVSILISVAFYTILERKILSYMQLRKGPNKVGLMGILQPFSDAIKLFNKTTFAPTTSNLYMMWFTPLLALMLSLIMWPLLPLSKSNILDSTLNTLIFFIISSLSVYTILSIGWSANSKYSLLGAIRSVAQMISYEINFFMLMLFYVLIFHTYSMSKFLIPQQYIPMLMGTSILIILWMITCLAEVNRSPFDFAEGESELVSGFNVEFMGALFAMIFLAEYTSMLLLSYISTIIFIGSLVTVFNIMLVITMTSTLLWVRATFPRFRFDLLMKVNWKLFLPVTTTLIIPALSFSLLFF